MFSDHFSNFIRNFFSKLCSSYIIWVFLLIVSFFFFYITLFLLHFFLSNRRYGDIIEAFHMQDVVPPQQPLYARIVIRTEAIQFIDHLLESTNKVKLSINGKHAWARKYVRKGNKSPMTSRAPSPTSTRPSYWWSISWNWFRCFNYEKMLKLCCQSWPSFKFLRVCVEHSRFWKNICSFYILYFLVELFKSLNLMFGFRWIQIITVVIFNFVDCLLC